MISVTKKKVEAKIKGLKPDAAAGLDKIGPRMLQELSVAIATPLTNIMRRSLEEGVIPEDWKEPMSRQSTKKARKVLREIITRCH